MKITGKRQVRRPFGSLWFALIFDIQISGK